jgi:diguanylate cyclase (GGDEF)-like protein
MLKRLTITVWATLFVTLVCGSLVAIDIQRSWSLREETLNSTRRSTESVARAMAQHGNDTFRAVDAILHGVKERMETDGTDARAIERLQRVMVGSLRKLPQLNGVFAFDAEGRWLVNSVTGRKLDTPVTDRAYFSYHRDNPEDNNVHIGAPIVSRSNGRWVIPLSRRLEHPDGSFAGVVVASIDVGYFRRFYERLDVGRSGGLVLVLKDGTVVLRKPYKEERIGTSIAALPLYKAYLAHPNEGTGEFVSVRDGEVRIASYQSLDDFPLFVLAAMSKREVLARWREDTIVHTSGVLALAALLAFLGYRLIRQIKLRLHAEEELRQARDALASLNTTLEKLALQDGLTGLANRRQFDATLGKEFSRAMRQGSPLAFAMIDVDYFKRFNDRYGHSAGDDCLRSVANAIRGQTPTRTGDLAARYGGEEIGILLPNTDEDGAWAVAERMRIAVLALRLEHGDSPLGMISISAGVAAVVPERGNDDPAVLIEAADRALYAAKNAGRNRVARASTAQ